MKKEKGKKIPKKDINQGGHRKKMFSLHQISAPGPRAEDNIP